MLLLAGDIGGTKTDLLLAEVDPQGRHRRDLAAARVASASYPDLETMLREFLGPVPPSLDAAAFGIAGPVVDGTCTTTNLPWQVDDADIAAHLKLPPARLALLNDFHALALGIGELQGDQLELLQDGEVDPRGPRAVIGAGTGLGEAIMIPTGDGVRVLATEGGHADFGPQDEIERRLLAHLSCTFGHVSYERVLSGAGIAAIYDFLIAEGLAVEQASTRTRMAAEDPAAVIGELALRGEDSACTATIDRFMRIYGAEAGNLALKVLPTGGLFVAGGIAQRLLPLLRRSRFLGTFLAKGRMLPLLAQLRVAVVLDPRTGLLGAYSAARDIER